MNIEYYIEYDNYKNLGMKKEAKASINNFIASFESSDEIIMWTFKYLSELPKDIKKIRHEIYKEIVFPILLKGFSVSNPYSLYWLARLWQNLASDKTLYNKADFDSPIYLLRKAIKIDGSNIEILTELKKEIFDSLSYAFHEWPSGVLYGVNGASLEECKLIREDIEYLMSIESDDNNKELLTKYLNYLDLYELRLVGKNTSHNRA